jgi:hypothetical protein
MSTMSQFFGGGGASIKAIQRGFVTTASASSGTIAISSVNTSKTELRLLGRAGGSQGCTIRLTSSTLITFESSAFTNHIISWELTEWN